MTTPARGRRSNGLEAPGWVAVIDIDPRMAETVLDLLHTAGIAAYVEPSPGATGTYREVRLPPTPTDRLFVDPQRRDEAAALLSPALEEHLRDLADDEPAVDPDDDVRTAEASPDQQVLPGLENTGITRRSDEQAVWDDLVSRLTGTDTSPVPPWPVDEDLDPPPTAGGSRILRRRSQPEDASAWLDPSPQQEPDPVDPDDDEHFEPPPPPPVGRITRATALALVGFAVGLLLILKPGVVGLLSSQGTFAAGLVVILASFGWLVYRLQDGPPLDSGPDDGAVV